MNVAPASQSPLYTAATTLGCEPANWVALKSLSGSIPLAFKTICGTAVPEAESGSVKQKVLPFRSANFVMPEPFFVMNWPL